MKMCRVRETVESVKCLIGSRVCFIGGGGGGVSAEMSERTKDGKDRNEVTMKPRTSLHDELKKKA